MFEPTQFRAAALNSFFEVAESAKEKEKIYYSHLGIEERKNQLNDSSVSELNEDKFNGSFCFNSSTILDLISISGNSCNSAVVSFSKCLLLTPMKPLEADKEQEVVVQIAGIKIDLDKSGIFLLQSK